MPYRPRAGDFGVAKGGGLAMRAVRAGTWSRYGHAAVAEVVDAVGQISVIEPMPDGCRRRVARPNEFVWSDVPLTDAQRATVVEYARGCVGRGYDWPAIGGFVTRWWAARLAALRPGRSRRAGPRYVDEPGGDALMCSEMVVRAYRRVGVDMGGGRPANAVSPGDLRQWLDDRTRATHRR